MINETIHSLSFILAIFFLSIFFVILTLKSLNKKLKKRYLIINSTAIILLIFVWILSNSSSENIINHIRKLSLTNDRDSLYLALNIYHDNSGKIEKKEIGSELYSAVAYYYIRRNDSDTKYCLDSAFFYYCLLFDNFDYSRISQKDKMNFKIACILPLYKKTLAESDYPKALFYLESAYKFIPEKTCNLDITSDSLSNLIKEIKTKVEVNNLSKTYILSIAINEYSYNHTYKELKKLINPISDSDSIISVLISKYQNFKKEYCNVFRLYNSNATLDSIEYYFKKMIKQIDNNDVLVLILNGHGYNDNLFLYESGFVPYDGRLDKSYTLLSYQRLLRFIESINSYVTFAIIDACYSGSIMNEEGRNNFKENEPRGRWILTSGRGNELSEDYTGKSNGPLASIIIDYLKKVKDSVDLNKLGMDIIDKFNKDLPLKQKPIFESIKSIGHYNGRYYLKRNKNYR